MRDLVEGIREQEADFFDEEESEVSKYLGERQAEKDRLEAEYGEERGRALVERQNGREYNSLALELVDRVTKHNITTLENAQEHFPATEPTYYELAEMIEVLRDQETKTAELIDEFHENDLPPIRSTDTDNQTAPSQSTNNEAAPSQNTSNSFQDSSDVHQTDFNSFDPFGEE